jgi:hypothetical protein
MATHRIYPHGHLQELAPEVWLLRGSSPRPVSRNMVVVRLISGDLVLHSVIALDDQGMKELEALGRPAYAIVPSMHHVMDAAFYKRRYPGLMMLCPDPIRLAIEVEVGIDDTVENVLPALGIRLHAVPATRSFEYVYDMPLSAGGRMLVFNDVMGNRGAPAKGVLGFLFGRLLWVGDKKPDVPPLYRMAVAKDRSAIRWFVANLGATHGLRLVTFSHGDPLTEHPGAILKSLAPVMNRIR